MNLFCFNIYFIVISYSTAAVGGGMKQWWLHKKQQSKQHWQLKDNKPSQAIWESICSVSTLAAAALCPPPSSSSASASWWANFRAVSRTPVKFCWLPSEPWSGGQPKGAHARMCTNTPLWAQYASHLKHKIDSPGGTGRSDKLTGLPALCALMASWYCYNKKRVSSNCITKQKVTYRILLYQTNRPRKPLLFSW